MKILSYNDFLIEGIDFEGNFTPLYHTTYYIKDIIRTDSLKPDKPSRRPKGICLTGFCVHLLILVVEHIEYILKKEINGLIIGSLKNTI